MIIYKAENKVNGKVYIGKTVQLLHGRRLSHLSSIRRNEYNTFFHRAIRKYGEENFEWVVLAEAESEGQLNAMEKFYIAAYKKLGKIYNMTEGGDGTCGHIKSEETKNKISSSHRKENLSEKSIKRYSEANKGEKNPQWGNHKTKETRIKLSEVSRGEKNHFYGKKHTEETKKKISERAKGRTHTTSEETKKKISESKKGEKRTEESRKKISAALKGRIPWNKGIRGCYSEETLKKISESQKTRLSKIK